MSMILVNPIPHILTYLILNEIPKLLLLNGWLFKPLFGLEPFIELLSYLVDEALVLHLSGNNILASRVQNTLKLRVFGNVLTNVHRESIHTELATALPKHIVVEIGSITIPNAISPTISPAIRYDVAKDSRRRLILSYHIQKYVIMRAVSTLMDSTRRVRISIFCTIFSNIVVCHVMTDIIASSFKTLLQFIHESLVVFRVEASEILVFRDITIKEITCMWDMLLIVGEGIKEDITVLVMCGSNLPIRA